MNQATNNFEIEPVDATSGSVEAIGLLEKIEPIEIPTLSPRILKRECQKGK